MATIENKATDLLRRLRRFRSRRKQLDVMHRLLDWLFFSLSAGALLLLIQSVVLLSPFLRWILLAAWALPTGAAAALHVLPSLWRLLLQPNQPPLNDIALEAGRLEGCTLDRMANALQLMERRGRLAEVYSPSLMDRAWERVAAELGDRDFLPLLDRRPLRSSARRAALLTLLAAAAILSPLPLLQGAQRMFYPNTNQADRGPAAIRVWPGSTDLLKGRDLIVRALPDRFGEPVQLVLLYPGHTEKIAMERCEQDTFCLTVRGLKDTTRYYVTAEGTRSETYTISVLEYPLLRSLQIELFPPVYTGSGSYRLDENIGDITALEGTRVRWRASVNKPLQSGSLVFTPGPRLPLTIADREISADFTVARSGQYTYEFRDVQGLINCDAIPYHIRLLPDQSPFVRIISPAREVDLDEEMRLPLLIFAQDDYGFSSMRVGYQILPGAQAECDSSRFRFVPVQIPSAKTDQIQVAFDWDLSGSPLLPDEVLVYFVQVFDNDTIHGPKGASSGLHRARFPSIFEMYQEISQEQDQALDGMQALHEKSEELREKLSDLSRQLKRMDQLSWEKKQEISDAVDRQKQANESLQEIAQRLDEVIEKFDRNNLLSPETQQKYQEIQQLYRDIMTPELKKALEQVDEAMQKIDPSLMQKAMEELSASSQDFEQSLDRTISLLKRLKMQQQVEQALRLSQEIAEKQKEIGEKSGRELPDRERVSREQESLKKAAESLQQQLADLREQSADEASQASEEISQAASAMEQAAVPSRMEKSVAELNRGNSQAVQQLSSAIQEDMQKVADHLQNAGSALSGAMQQRAMQAMTKSVNNLLALSKMQESLKQETRSLPETSARVQAAAEAQQQLQDGLQSVADELYAAAKESFGIQSAIGGSIGKAAMDMESALTAFENRNLDAASQSQGQAMSAMNDAVRQLFSSMQSMMRGGSGAGMSMEQFMQQLQNMAGRQQGLNTQTEALGQGERLGLARQAAMSRLAAEQATLRQALEEMMQQLGQQGGGSAGSLEKVAEEMKEVEKDLQQSGISRQTLERQNRILSRMLDAQKSIREREYSRKRKAETGKEYLAISPEEPVFDGTGDKDRLQQDLLRARKEGYTRDYLELIRQYFEALAHREALEKKP